MQPLAAGFPSNLISIHKYFHTVMARPDRGRRRLFGFHSCRGDSSPTLHRILKMSRICRDLDSAPRPGSTDNIYFADSPLFPAIFSYM